LRIVGLLGAILPGDLCLCLDQVYGESTKEQWHRQHPYEHRGTRQGEATCRELGFGSLASLKDTKTLSPPATLSDLLASQRDETTTCSSYASLDGYASDLLEVINEFSSDVPVIFVGHF
jgi:hypothetical protein